MTKFRMTHPELVDASLGDQKVSNYLAQSEIKTSGELMYVMGMEELKLDPEMAPAHEVTGRAMWAHVQWVRSERPILRLSDELRDVLLRTEIPREPLDKIPEVPFDGFFLVVDGGYTLRDAATGEHEIEGIYVCRDRVYKTKKREEIVDGLQIVAVGEDKGGKVASGWMRNDTLTYFTIVGGVNLTELYDGSISVKETLQVVLNLLLLWNSERSPVVTKSVTPPTPKSPGKRKKLERRGLSVSKYIRLEIREGYLKTEVARDGVEGWDGPTHVALVRGFFRRYWVTEKPEAQILGEKISSTGKPMYLVRRFIAPHRALRRGAAPDQNTYEVVR